MRHGIPGEADLVGRAISEVAGHFDQLRDGQIGASRVCVKAVAPTNLIHPRRFGKSTGVGKGVAVGTEVSDLLLKCIGAGLSVRVAFRS